MLVLVLYSLSICFWPRLKIRQTSWAFVLPRYGSFVFFRVQWNRWDLHFYICLISAEQNLQDFVLTCALGNFCPEIFVALVLQDSKDLRDLGLGLCTQEALRI